MMEKRYIDTDMKMVRRCKTRVRRNIERIKRAKTQLVFNGCYDAILDSASMPIISFGLTLHRPEEIPRTLKNIIEISKIKGVSTKILDEAFEFRKMVRDKKTTEMSGKDLDTWLSKTEEFLEDMVSLSEEIEKDNLTVPFPGVS
jgi:hypothetical protein